MDDGSLVSGRFTDGRSAKHHLVAIEANAGGLLLTAETGEQWNFAYSGIARLPQESKADAPVLRFAEKPNARLVLTGDGVVALLDLLKTRSAGFEDLIRPSPADRRAIVIWAAAGLALVAIAYFGIPRAATVLAPLMPASWEAKLGDQTETMMRVVFRTTTCASPQPKPLTALITRLSNAGGLPHPVRATMVGTKLVNAFALPGNHIFITTGLIDELEGGDELAGIVGHEIGHLKHHDPTAALISQAGWSALATMFFGMSSQGQMSTLLLTMSYSRELEARADDTSLEILRTSGLDSAGYERAMRRFAEKHKDDLGILSSHPPSLDRAEYIAAAGPKGEKVMPAEDWQAIKAYASTCEPKAEKP